MLAFPTSRLLLFAVAAAVTALLGYALYTQYYEGLEPCPLCMSQRLFYLLTGVTALIGGLHNRRTRAYGAAIALFAAAGAAIAARQVWLQHLPPDQVPACGPSLEYMLQTLPFSDALLHMLRGDGNCAVVDWRFLGLSMAGWSLICFAGFAAIGLWQLLRRR